MVLLWNMIKYFPESLGKKCQNISEDPAGSSLLLHPPIPPHPGVILLLENTSKSKVPHVWSLLGLTPGL